MAMRLGAADYLLKPIVNEELDDALRRAVQRHLLQVDHQLAQEPAEPAVSEQEEQGVFASQPEPREGWTPMPPAEAMKAPEKQILLAALEANGWNRGETAKQLDINRTTLYKKIRQYRLDEPA